MSLVIDIISTDDDSSLFTLIRFDLGNILLNLSKGNLIIVGVLKPTPNSKYNILIFVFV